MVVIQHHHVWIVGVNEYLPLDLHYLLRLLLQYCLMLLCSICVAIYVIHLLRYEYDYVNVGSLVRLLHQQDLKWAMVAEHCKELEHNNLIELVEVHMVDMD